MKEEEIIKTIENRLSIIKEKKSKQCLYTSSVYDRYSVEGAIWVLENILCEIGYTKPNSKI